MQENPIMDKSLLISALNSQHSFQCFDLLQKLIKTPNFHLLAFPEKNAIFIQEAKKSRFQVYKNYNISGFFKDISCEIAMNLKKTRSSSFQDLNWRISAFLSLFFELKTWTFIEEKGFGFEYSAKKGLFPYLEGIIEEKELFLDEEVFEVAIQVHNFAGELLGFIREFEEIASKTLFPLENLKDIEDCFELLRNTMKMVFFEEKFRAFSDMIIRENIEDFWAIFMQEKRTSSILELLEFMISKEKNQKSLILAYFTKKEVLMKFIEAFWALKTKKNKLKVLDLLMILAEKSPEILLLLQDLYIRLGNIEDSGFFNESFNKLLVFAQKECFENPEILDFLLNFLEKWVFQQRNYSLDLENSIFPLIFSAICQNSGFLLDLLRIDLCFVQRMIKMTKKTSNSGFPLIISILNFAFLISPEKSLLKIEDFEAFFLVINEISSEKMELLLETMEIIQKARNFDLSIENFSILIEELEKILQSNSHYSSEKAQKSLISILKRSLSRFELFNELKKSRIFLYLLKINESEDLFLDLRVLILKNELFLNNSHENRQKDLRKYLEIMFSNVISNNFSIVHEIENFNRLDILMNIVLTLRKLIKSPDLRKILKEIKVFDNFLKIFNVLSEKGVFLREFLLLLTILINNNEYLQYFIKKSQFLNKKVYSKLRSPDFIENKDFIMSVLSLGMEYKENSEKSELFFGKPNFEGLFLNEKLKEIVKNKTKSGFFRNFLIIHENLSIFLRKIFKSFRKEAKFAFFNEFFETFQGEKLGILGTSLFPELLPIFSVDFNENKENLAFFFKILKANHSKISGNSLSGFETIDFLMKTLEIIEDIQEKSFFLNNFLEIVYKDLPSIIGIGFFIEKVLFFPETGLKSLDFSLMFWLFLENSGQNSISLITLLNFSYFRPEFAISIEKDAFLLIEYRGIKKKSQISFPLEKWVFFSIVSNEITNQSLSISLYFNGLLMETLDFLINASEKGQLDLLIGDSGTSEPKSTENRVFRLESLLLLNSCLNHKEIAIFYLLNSRKGRFSMKNNRPKLNLSLINRPLLDILDLNVKKPEETEKSAILRCFMPDFTMKTLLHIDFSSLQSEIYIENEALKEKTMNLIENIEKFSVFKVFLNLKKLLKKQSKKGEFLALKNHEKKAFFLGFDENEDFAYLKLSFNRKSIIEILEESDFLSKFLLLLKKTQEPMFFRKLIEFLLKIIGKSEILLEKFEENLEVFKEILIEKAIDLSLCEIETFENLAIRTIDSECELIENPRILKAFFLNNEISYSGIYRNLDIYQLLLRLLKKKHCFQSINGFYLKSQKSLLFLLESLFLSPKSPESFNSGFELLYEFMISETFLLKTSISIIKDMLKPVLLENPSFSSLNKNFMEKALFFEEQIFEVFLKILKSTQKSRFLLNSDFFIGFFRFLQEKSPKHREKVLETLISCFLMSLFQENEEKTPFYYEMLRKDLSDFAGNEAFYRIGLNFLLKNEKNNRFSIENNEKARFGLLFRSLIESLENIKKILSFFQEKDHLISFRTENPDFLRNQSDLDTLYQIFKPKSEKSPENKDFSCEKLRISIFELILEKEKEEFNSKSLKIIDFLRNHEFSLFFMPNFYNLSRFLEDFLKIYIDNEGLTLENGVFEESLMKLPQIIDFLVKIDLKDSIFIDKLNNLIIEALYQRSISTFLGKNEDILINSLEKEFFLMKTVFSEDQYESFSIKIVAFLAEKADFSQEKFFLSFLIKTFNNFIFKSPNRDIQWAILAIFMNIRKIKENKAFSLNNKSSSKVKKSIKLSISEEIIEKALFSLQEYWKNLVFRAFDYAIKANSEERLEKLLDSLISNKELVFSDISSDFLNALIYISYELIIKFSRKIAEKSVFLLLLIPKEEMKFSMSFGDFDGFSQGFDNLLKIEEKSLTIEAFLFLISHEESIKQKIELIIYKKLWGFYLNFLNENQLLLVETQEPLKSIENPNKRKSSEKVRTSISFEENPKSQEINENAWDLTYQLEKTRFLSEKMKKSLRKFEKTEDLKNYYEKASISKAFSFKQANKIGYGYCKRLVVSIETPEELLIKKPENQAFSSEKTDIEALFEEKALIDTENKELPDFLKKNSEILQKSNFLSDFSKTSDSFMNLSLRKSKTEEKVLINKLNKSQIREKLLKIQDFCSISEEISDFFNIAILKEGSKLIESLLLISQKALFLIKSCPLLINDQEPYFHSEISFAKSKWFLPRNQSFFASRPFLQKKSKILRISYSEIAEIHAKRYLLYPNAIEIFYNQKALFLVANIDEREAILQKIMGFPMALKILISGNNAFFLRKPHSDVSFDFYTQEGLLALISPLWEYGKLSSFEYLQFLNLISGRTSSDLSQYPVFPWVLSDYNSKTLFLDKEAIYRDLSKPIGALTKEKVLSIKERFAYTSQEGLFPAFHHGSHYSSQTLVLYYLIRILPFSIQGFELQGGKFDLSDRLFDSMEEAWFLALNHDVKELIPELFYFEEGFLNLNNLDFGIRQNSEKVEDLKLPFWALGNMRIFVLFMRKALENAKISQWIDLIWGFKQKGKSAIESLNKYFFITYEGGLRNLEKFSINERNAFLQQINEYGQIPKQLFTISHIERKRKTHVSAFFYEKRRLEKFKPELFYEIEAENQTFQIDFAEIHRKIGALTGFRRISEVLKAEKGHEKAEKPEKGQEILENSENEEDHFNLFAIHQNQCLLKEGKPEEIELFDYNNEESMLLLRRNRVFQGFDKGDFAISEAISIPEASILIIASPFGSISFYSYKRKAKKLDILEIGLIFEGKRGLFDKEILDIEPFLMKKLNFIEFSPRIRRFASLKPGKSYGDLRKASDIENIKKKPLNREKSLVFMDETYENPAFLYKFTSISRNLNYHKRKVLILAISRGFGLLLSCDEVGFVIIWDFYKGKFLRKFQIRHFIEKSKKIREKAVFLSVCEENSDFAIISKNYISVFNVNGVLLAYERKERARFSCCKLLQNLDSYEEDYILTGDLLGVLRLWVFKIDEKKAFKVPNSQYYRENMRNNGSFNGEPMFGLENVWEFRVFKENIGKELEVLGIWISKDQKRMVSWHRNGQVYRWKGEEDEEKMKKCGICGGGFGLLEKKNICGYCKMILCGNCCKNEAIVPEMSLKKPSKICEECLKLLQNHKTLHLYDNY